MTDDRLAVLLEGLSKQTHLRKINLQNCELGKRSLDHLIKILSRKESNSLKELRLSDLKISQLTLGTIMEELVTNKLHLLQLSHLHLTHHDTIYNLCDFIMSNSKLKDLFC